MRLFVGIGLDGPARDEVLRVREELLGAISKQGVRFVRPEKLHLTLAFLGNVSADRVEALKEALAGVSVPKLDLRIGELGCFPDARRPKVVWLGVEGDLDALAVLADQVRSTAVPLAPETDLKKFSAHITLARISPGSQEIGRALGRLGLNVEPACLPAEAITLFESRPDGSYASLLQVECQ